jgi:DivIVA domain-containing protein
VSLSPKEVKNRKFHQSLTGYDTKEVSLFLKDVALELEKISMQNIHLSEANKSLDRQVAQLRVKISLSPNKGAGSGRDAGSHDKQDALLHEARLEAEEIVRLAKLEAAGRLASQEEEAKRKAREAARGITAQARTEAAEILHSAR